MNALAQSAAPPANVAAVPLLRTLALCDLVDSTALVERLGDQRAAELFRKHDRLTRALLQTHGGREIDKTDGFLVMFDRPIQAVTFALDYQRGLKELALNEQCPMSARVGIHVGDILTWDNAPDDIAKGAKLIEVEGLVKPIASRLMQLALPSQILMSGVAYALSHRSQGELAERLSLVRWRTHGRYRFKGIPDPIPVFEVGEEGMAPLRPPPWSGKAHREVPFWRRPATMVIEALVLAAVVAIPIIYVLRPEPAIAFANRDWVVVGDLKNLTGDASFDESLAMAFRIGLEQSRYVNVLSDLKTRETVKLMQQDPEKTAVDRAVGSEIAIRDGARALILPTVAEIGGRVRVTAEVIDPSTQTTVYSESADGVGEASVLPSLDKVNQQLRVRLGEALATVTSESKPLQKVTTSNLDALRAYTVGRAEYGKGAFKEALALYRQAVKLDPGFALARVALGQTLVFTSGGDDAEGIAEVRRAAADSERLSPLDALYTQAWLANFEMPRAALEKWQTLAKLYPDFTPGTGALGYYAYEQSNRFDLAIPAIEQNTVATNPSRGPGEYLLASLYLGDERYADAQLHFERAIADGFVTQNEYYAYLFAAQRKFDRADDILKAGRPLNIAGGDALGDITRIALAVDRGNWKDAQAIIDHATVAYVDLKGSQVSDLRLIDMTLRQLSSAPQKYKPLISAYVRTALESKAKDTPDGQFTLLIAASLAASSGEPALAKSAIGGVAPVTRSGDFPNISSLLGVVQAQIDILENRAPDAIKALKLQMTGSEFYFSHRVLMTAYIASKDDAAALLEAKWLSAHRGRAYVEQFGQVALLPMNVAISSIALLDAAEIAQRSGKLDEARSALANFREAWKDTSALSFVSDRVGALDRALSEKR